MWVKVGDSSTIKHGLFWIELKIKAPRYIHCKLNFCPHLGHTHTRTRTHARTHTHIHTTREAKYLQLYNEECSYNNYCSGRAVIITYILWVCVCSLSYPARNAHAPYCHLWPAPLYNIFPHYLINNKIFEKKKLFNIKLCFGFFYKFVWNIFHFKNTSAG